MKIINRKAYGFEKNLKELGNIFNNEIIAKVGFNYDYFDINRLYGYFIKEYQRNSLSTNIKNALKSKLNEKNK